jgi:hypothetical protein
MTYRHDCPGIDECRICRQAIAAAEDGEFYTEAELDGMAEAEARNMVYGR